MINKGLYRTAQGIPCLLIKLMKPQCGKNTLKYYHCKPVVLLKDIHMYVLKLTNWQCTTALATLGFFWSMLIRSSPTMCHMSHVTCHKSYVPCQVSFYFFWHSGIVGGGSVINGVYPVQFYRVYQARWNIFRNPNN